MSFRQGYTDLKKGTHTKTNFLKLTKNQGDEDSGEGQTPEEDKTIPAVLKKGSLIQIAMGTKYFPHEDPKLIEGLTESVTRSLIELTGDS